MAIVCLWGTYVVGINLFLSTSLFNWVINQEPEVVDIHFRRGWSFWPTRVHARDLSIRGRDSNVEWILRLDRVEFEVSLLSLAKQKFDVSMAHGSGISFRARQSLPSKPESEEAYADLPDIEGLQPFRVRPEQTQQDKDEVWNDSVYKLWTVHLEGVEARDVREVWIDKARFVGSADIYGRFFLKPVRKADVGPVHVTAKGRVFVGERAPAVEDIHAEATVRIEPFDPRTVKGPDLMHQVSIDFEGRAHVPAADELPLPLPNDMSLAGVIDVRRLALHMKRGVFLSDSHLDAVLPEASVFTKRHVFTGKLALLGDIENVDATPTLRFRLQAQELGMSIEIHKTPRDFGLLLRAREVIVVGDSCELDTAHALRDLHTTVDVFDADLPKAEALGLYIPKNAGITIRSGSAQASAHLESWFGEKRVKGHAKLSARALVIGAPNISVTGSTTAEAKFDAYHWEPERFDNLSLDVNVERGALASARAPNVTLVEVTGLKVALRSPSLLLEKPLHEISAHVEIPQAAVIDQGLLRKFLPEELRIASGKARFSIGLDLLLRDAVASGTATLAATRFGFLVKDQNVVADVRAAARVHHWNIDKGTLSIDDVRVDIEHARMADATIDAVSVRARLPAFSFDKPSYDEADMDLHLANANMPDARILAAFFPQGSDTKILSGKAIANGDVHISGAKQTASGGVEVVLQNAGLRFESTDLTGDFRVVAKASGYDRAKKKIDLSGSTLTMSHVSTSNATVKAKDWAGRISIASGGFSLGDHPELDAVVKVDARDANPVLAIIFKNDLPGVVAGLTQMPRLDASARITLAPKWLGLHDVVARGGDFAIHGSFASGAERRRGAFIVEKGLFSVGLRFNDDVVAIRFFGLDGWMREQQGLVAVPPN